VDQESVRIVAAIEVPLSTTNDRSELVRILRANANEGLHVDNVSKRWREFEAGTDTNPADRGTIYVGVWGDPNDGELIADVSDRSHPGRAWITFVKGQHPIRAAKFRQAVLLSVERRWPNARMLPVLPSGAMPLSQDLQLTSKGYKVKLSAAASYGLPLSSPLVARE
jgi:hypothetical protein